MQTPLYALLLESAYALLLGASSCKSYMLCTSRCVTSATACEAAREAQRAQSLSQPSKQQPSRALALKVQGV